jgi:hypothetical protein
MAFFSELVSDATSRGIKVVIYSGNNDLLVGHFGTEGDLAKHFTSFELKWIFSCNSGQSFDIISQVHRFDLLSRTQLGPESEASHKGLLQLGIMTKETLRALFIKKEVLLICCSTTLGIKFQISNRKM